MASEGRGRHALVGAGFFAVLLGGCDPSAQRVPGPPTDAVLTARFSSLRDTLAELVSIASPDHHVRYDSLTAEAVAARQRQLLAAAGLPRYFRAHSDSLIYFPVWEDRSTRPVSDNDAKGYVYATRLPGTADTSLDVWPGPDPSSHGVTRYRHLDGPWYLFRHRGKIPGDPESAI